MAPVLLLFLVSWASAQNPGEKIFNETCVACHTIGKGKLIGPDLANIEDHLSRDWIGRFIKSSQTVIQSGDQYADSLFKAFNQIPMPDHANLTDTDIDNLLAYIKEKSSAPPSVESSSETLTGDSKRGKELFTGNIRFTNRGASCNSCHNVEMKGYLTGGALGKDLTHATTRLSESGVSAIISGLPFPQMKETYSAHPVTPQEIADLTAFLTEVDKQTVNETTGAAGNYLLAGGLTGIIVLLSLYSVFWIRRKKGPVNFFIFKRQIKSA